MQIVSQSDATKVNNMGKVSMHIYESDLPRDLNIRSFRYSAYAGGEVQFALGACCSAEINMTVDGVGLNLENKRLSVKWSVGETEYPLLTGMVYDPVAEGGVTSFTLRDAIYEYGSTEYDPDRALLNECTAGDALQDIANKLHAPIDPATKLSADAITLETGISNLKLGITLAAAAGEIAALMGGNAMIGRDGHLTVKTLSTVNAVTDVYSGGDSFREDPYRVTGLVYRRADEVTIESDTGNQTITQTVDYLTGEEGNRILVENQLVSQTLADNAWNIVGNQEFYTGNFDIPGGLLFEPGDIIQIALPSGNKTIPITQISVQWDGGCRSNIVATGAPILKTKPVGFIQKKLSDIDKKVYNLQTSVNGLVSTAAEIISDTEQKITSIIQNTEAIVQEAMSSYVETGDFDAFQSTYTSEMAQMSNEISINLTHTIKLLNEFQDETRGNFDSITKFFRFTDEGLIIGESGNAVLLRLDNNIMQFLQNNVPALYINPTGVHAEEVYINSIILGKYVFRYETDGRLSLRKIRDEV